MKAQTVASSCSDRAQAGSRPGSRALSSGVPLRSSLDIETWADYIPELTGWMIPEWVSNSMPEPLEKALAGNAGVEGPGGFPHRHRPCRSACNLAAFHHVPCLGRAHRAVVICAF